MLWVLTVLASRFACRRGFRHTSFEVRRDKPTLTYIAVCSPWSESSFSRRNRNSWQGCFFAGFLFLGLLGGFVSCVSCRKAIRRVHVVAVEVAFPPHARQVQNGRRFRALDRAPVSDGGYIGGHIGGIYGNIGGIWGNIGGIK